MLIYFHQKKSCTLCSGGYFYLCWIKISDYCKGSACERCWWHNDSYRRQLVMTQSEQMDKNCCMITATYQPTVVNNDVETNFLRLKSHCRFIARKWCRFEGEIAQKNAHFLSGELHHLGKRRLYNRISLLFRNGADETGWGNWMISLQTNCRLRKCRFSQTPSNTNHLDSLDDFFFLRDERYFTLWRNMLGIKVFLKW